MADGRRNFAVSTITIAPVPAATGLSCAIQSGHASRFPAAPFNVVVRPAGLEDETTLPDVAEIIRVTGASGASWTIQRAQEGTGARTIQAGDLVYLATTVKTVTDLEAAIAASASDLTAAIAASAGDLTAAIDAVASSSVPVTAVGAASGVASLDSGGKVPSSQLPAGQSVPDATSSTKGAVQLAGDLAGTAEAPTVPGLASKVSTSAVGAASGVASLDSSGKVPTSQLPAGQAGADATTSSKGIVQLAGDLAGTADAPTVPGLAGKVNSSAVGAAGGVASLDSGGKVPTSQLPAGQAGADATTSSKGIVQLAGDLAGTADAPTVPGLAGKVSTSAVGAASGVAGLDSGGKVPTSQLPTLPVPDATSSVKGGIQLTGDLGGSASSPTVPGLASKVNTSAVGAASGVASLDSGGKVPSSQLPSMSVPDATSSVKGGIQLTGDLGGSASSPTVPGLASKVNTSAVGAASGVASLDSGGKLPSAQLPSHSHAAGDVSSGTFAVARLGTGSAAAGTYLDGSGAWTALPDQAHVPVNARTAAYTLVLTDDGKAIEVTASSGVAVTVPPNSSVAFPVGAVIEVLQGGAGAVTISPGSGVTLRTASTLVTRAQWSTIGLRKRATDEWVVSGDTA